MLTWLKDICLYFADLNGIDFDMSYDTVCEFYYLNGDIEEFIVSFITTCLEMIHFVKCDDSS